jgi:hypothetical protein
MNTFKIDHYGEKTLAIREQQYERGGLAVQLIDAEDGAPYARVSIYVAGVRLALDEFVFKTYSENAGLLEGMKAAGVVEETGRFAEAGHAEPQPVCRLVKK